MDIGEPANGGALDALELVRKALGLCFPYSRGQKLGSTMTVAGEKADAARGDEFDDTPLGRDRDGWGGRSRLSMPYRIAGAAGGDKAPKMDLVESTGVDEAGVLDRVKELVGLTDGLVEQHRIAEGTGSTGQKRQHRGSLLGAGCGDRSLVEPVDGRAEQAGLAQLVAVHAQSGGSQSPVIEGAHHVQALGGPERGSGQPILGQHVSQSRPETQPGVRKEPKDTSFGAPVPGAGFQASHKRPQFGDGLGRSPALAGDFGEPHGGGAELDHRPVVGVGRIGDAQDMRGQSESLGDVTQAPDIAQIEPPRFEWRLDFMKGSSHGTTFPLPA
ncbi:hypothetical protein ACIPPN_30885 [Streptomyces diastaticus]|uniref:hypothetical protein n=1 Tax=Streptomyces diastaticus TaxID=1956 RepID=UPI00382191B8